MMVMINFTSGNHEEIEMSMHEFNELEKAFVSGKKRFLHYSAKDDMYHTIMLDHVEGYIYSKGKGEKHSKNMKFLKEIVKGD